MYDVKFYATDDADWSETIELIDGDTGLALAEAATATEFEVSVKTDGGTVVLSASYTAGTITKPATNEILWRFTAAQMNDLVPGTTYRVGLRMTDASSHILQLAVGELAIIDGGFA
jgi:hypothetical protein